MDGRRMAARPSHREIGGGEVSVVGGLLPAGSWSVCHAYYESISKFQCYSRRRICIACSMGALRPGAVGMDCKSVAKATQGSNPGSATLMGTAPDLQECGRGRSRWVRPSP